MSAEGSGSALIGEPASPAIETLAERAGFLQDASRLMVAGSLTKRIMDVILAVLVLLFVLPLLITVAVAIKVDSRGSVLFVQRRTGLGGRAIKVLKFRTMSVKEDGDVIPHAQKNDQRVTRVGAFLRRSSIDELPQLWNVLKGEMSLVGPRPHALAHDQYYGALVPGYTSRFRARPGITGLAQVSGHRGPIGGPEGMAARVAADNLYINTWSFWLDVRILARTVLDTPFHSNAY